MIHKIQRKEYNFNIFGNMETEEEVLNSTEENNDAQNISIISGGNNTYVFDFSQSTLQTKKYVSFFATVMNLLNSLVGAEILSISHSMKYCGLYVSVGLLTLIAVFSYIATVLIIKMQKSVNAESLHDLAAKLLGNGGALILTILTLLFTYSCCIAYLIVGGDNIQSWFKLLHHEEYNSGWRRSIIMFIYSICLPVMLTIPRRMTFLSIFSTLSIFCLVLFVVILAYKVFKCISNQGISKVTKAADLNFGFFNALAIYALMFALPSIILPILKPTHPGLAKRYQILGTAFSTCYILVLISGILGYLMFGNDAHDIILTSFPDNDVAIQVVRISFFIVVTASYPVISLSIITDLSALLYKIHIPNNLSGTQRFVVLLMMNIPPVLIGMVCPRISPVLGIGGALGGCMTNFFFPSILWLKFIDKPKFHIINILCYLFAFFGITSSCIATYRAFVVAFNPNVDS